MRFCQFDADHHNAPADRDVGLDATGRELARLILPGRPGTACRLAARHRRPGWSAGRQTMRRPTSQLIPMIGTITSEHGTVSEHPSDAFSAAVHTSNLIAPVPSAWSRRRWCCSAGSDPPTFAASGAWPGAAARAAVVDRPLLGRNGTQCSTGDGCEARRRAWCAVARRWPGGRPGVAYRSIRHGGNEVLNESWNRSARWRSSNPSGRRPNPHLGIRAPRPGTPGSWRHPSSGRRRRRPSGARPLHARRSIDGRAARWSR